MIDSGMIIRADDDNDLTSWFSTAESGGVPRIFNRMLVYRVNDSVKISFNNSKYCVTVFCVLSFVC